MIKKKKVFIDGVSDSIAPRIEKRLSNRDDVEIISLPDDMKKDLDARKEFLNAADIVFLCLPDAAAKSAVTMIDNLDTIVIDTSSAHGGNTGWAYGFTELSPEFEENIKRNRRIAVPGCYAIGFNALIYPLIKAGLLPKNAQLSAHSITGCSIGGRAMIAEYQSKERSPLLSAPRQHTLDQSHKQVPEMAKITGLTNLPILCPYISNFYSGAEITIPLFKSQLCNGGIEHIRAIYKATYNYPLVHFNDHADENGYISSCAFANRDSMQIEVYGNEDRILLVARYDNLGKGSIGNAIECMNIKLGCEYTKGLVI